MDKQFKESGLLFSFSNVIDAYKADIPSYSGLSAVDFIVELNDNFLFIEVKNPDNRKSHPQDVEKFEKDINSAAFYPKMSSKFKDSLLKELARGKIFKKPITYIFILEFKRVDIHQRHNIFERISNLLPKFKEEMYSSVKQIKFLLYDISEFKNEYAGFNVEEL